MGVKYKNLVILGGTGSVGASTLNVVRNSQSSYQVFALSGYANAALLIKLALEFKPRYVVTSNENVQILSQALRHLQTEVLAGEDALVDIVKMSEVDIVLAGIVGKAGLVPTLAAANAGKTILLANKESMVMAGPLFRRAILESGARILPIDSEHNAIFQTLPDAVQKNTTITQDLAVNNGVHQLVLTASGGPFLNLTPEELKKVTPAAACKHPNWNMGAKVSVDSASLMNKGLELIEACYLFGVQEKFVKVVIHPQSIVHSMVSYVDGSTLAHLSQPSMEVPIGHALAWPQRHATGVQPLAWDQVLQLDFLPLVSGRFPCFDLARQAMQLAENTSCAAPAVLNAANEIAVAAFLAKIIGFLDIPKIVEASLVRFSTCVAHELVELINLDQEVRSYASAEIKQQHAGILLNSCF